jgi:hypothetical protein
MTRRTVEELNFTLYKHIPEIFEEHGKYTGHSWKNLFQGLNVGDAFHVNTWSEAMRAVCAARHHSFRGRIQRNYNGYFVFREE